jgi:hypothetical protein
VRTRSAAATATVRVARKSGRGGFIVTR